MVTQQKVHSQVQAPQTWDKPTTQARVGDYIHEPFQPIMVVVDKDLLPNGKIWLLVKPVSARYTQEWVVDPEPALEPQQQQQSQQEKTEPIQPVGFAGDTVGVNLRPTHKAFATMHEWEEAARLIPPGYRIKNGWFYDSHGGRCNLPSSKLSPRQIDILMGDLPVR
jgi:hypothetical protein